jgi:hypothetical protein
MNADINFKVSNSSKLSDRRLKNMDLLVSYINANQTAFGMRLEYSTPGRYLDAVYKQQLVWGGKTDDFLPYASAPYTYWYAGSWLWNLKPEYPLGPAIIPLVRL